MVQKASSCTLGDGNHVSFGTLVDWNDCNWYRPYKLVGWSESPVFPNHVRITPQSEESGQVWTVHPSKLVKYENLED